MFREHARAWLAVTLVCAACLPARAQERREAAAPRRSAPPKPKTPVPQPAPRTKAPPPSPAPSPAPAPPPAPPRSTPHPPDDEAVLRDLELYMLYEMLNDYEMFYDDDTTAKAR